MQLELRQSSRENERVQAEKWGVTALRYQQWDNGVGGSQVCTIRCQPQLHMLPSSHALQVYLNPQEDKPGKVGIDKKSTDTKAPHLVQHSDANSGEPFLYALFTYEIESWLLCRSSNSTIKFILRYASNRGPWDGSLTLLADICWQHICDTVPEFGIKRLRDVSNVAYFLYAASRVLAP